MGQNTIADIAQQQGLSGTAFANVPEAYEAALRNAQQNDFIYVGGSSFVVADLLAYLVQK